MVSTRRFGRLGNELYQYAAVIGYAIKHGIEWSLPRSSNDAVWNPTHFQHLYNQKWVEGREDVLLNENGHHYQEIPFNEDWRNKQIVLNGYWQSYKYFDFCRDEVLNIFNFPYERKDGYCSIHIRRGDYLLHPTKHPVVTMDYLELAVSYIYGYYDVFNFLVHSDDIAWCKKNMPLLEYDKIKFEYSEGKNEVEDLISMSCCEHQICSNSTMAVWAAELNQNQKKVVIVPHENNWFGVDNAHLNIHDLYRSEWVQIEY